MLRCCGGSAAFIGRLFVRERDSRESARLADKTALPIEMLFSGLARTCCSIRPSFREIAPAPGIYRSANPADSQTADSLARAFSRGGSSRINRGLPPVRADSRTRSWDSLLVHPPPAPSPRRAPPFLSFATQIAIFKREIRERKRERERRKNIYVISRFADRRRYGLLDL